MSEASLDQIVKGAPPPNVSLPSVAAAASASPPDNAQSNSNSSAVSAPGSTTAIATAPSSSSPSDPTSLLPSSPPQIYLNLLILEASLRSQYLTLRARRRQNTFVLIVLALWITYFIYCQFLRPRADGTGIVGGSEYWLVDVIEKVALLSGLVMSLLFKLTGQWERGVRWPSRWLRTTNRGLKGMNCKIVVLKGAWWREGMSHLSFLFPISTLVDTPGSNYQQIEYEQPLADRSSRSSRPQHRKHKNEVAEEDIARGGDFIKILLLPKHFTPEFRDNWDTYRAEYWDQENQRRAELRKRFRAREKQLAKQQSPWFWWTPGRRIINRSISSPAATRIRADTEKSLLLSSSYVPPSIENVTHGGSQRQRRAASVLKDEKGSQSRSSSRSSVGPGAVDFDERERRWSTSTTSSVGGERRRRKAVGSGDGGLEQQRRVNPAGRTKAPAVAATSADSIGSGSRPSTPNAAGHVLRSQASNLSSMSSGSDGDTPPRQRTGDVAVKKEPLD